MRLIFYFFLWSIMFWVVVLIGMSPEQPTSTQRVPRWRIGERPSDMGVRGYMPPRTNWWYTPRTSGRGGVYRWSCHPYKMP